jgi:TolB protein
MLPTLPRRTLTWSLSGVALVVSVLALAASAQAAYPGANGKIAFQSNSAGNFDIFTMNADGSASTLVHGSTSADQSPSWSPDGTKIAFALGTSIYTVNANGSGLTSVGTDGQNPTWSPDGTKIAFNANADGDQDIFTKNADGSGILIPITSNTSTDENPSWSPDGTKIAYQNNGDGDYDIYTSNSDGSLMPANITANAGIDDVQPDWSPDAAKLAFKRGSPNGDIFTINENGTAATAIAASVNDESNPAWSPDGTKIAYAQTGDILVRVVGAGTSVNLTNSAATDGAPSWQPTYQIPKSASSIQTSLVPAFRQTINTTQCSARGGTPTTHGAPDIPGGSTPQDLSCSPPAFLPGTRAAIGIQAVGTATITVVPGNLATVADEADDNLVMSLTDVRAGSATGPDYLPVAEPFSDITVIGKLRITDTHNGSSLTTPATVEDLEPVYVPVNCLATADPKIGSNCSITTSADTLLPGMIKEGKNQVIDLFRIRVKDSGVDNVRGNTDDKEFLTQGIYNP